MFEVESFDKGDVIYIQFSLEPTDHSAFPDPLVTIDYDRMHNVRGITFIGPAAKRLQQMP